MAATVAGAITHFQGDATLVAVSGPYRDRAIERTNFPYAIVTELETTPDASFGSRYIEETRVRFGIHHTAAATLKTYLDALKTRFDRQSFSVTGGTLMSSTLLTEQLIDTSRVSPDNKRVFFAAADFLFKVDRAR